MKIHFVLFGDFFPLFQTYAILFPEIFILMVLEFEKWKKKEEDYEIS